MMTEKIDDYTLTYDDSPEAKDRLYDACLEWFKAQEAFSGESIAQRDNPVIEAPWLLCKVAEEIFQFKQVYDDEI